MPSHSLTISLVPSHVSSLKLCLAHFVYPSLHFLNPPVPSYAALLHSSASVDLRIYISCSPNTIEGPNHMVKTADDPGALMLVKSYQPS
ncbi:hypothetical protein BJX63DRAFT_332644 [Aspergillus granulosus]|uniref:Uncharacterized protein n=1 Tax=Aspergillus granulosus TaxID=176169 RepID=A0ABR4H3D2_9EURO